MEYFQKCVQENLQKELKTNFELKEKMKEIQKMIVESDKMLVKYENKLLEMRISSN